MSTQSDSFLLDLPEGGLDARSGELLDHAYQRFCGVQLLVQRPGFCRTRIEVTDAIDNLGQTLHGGVIYSLMDVTSMLATLPMVEAHEYPLTTSLSVSVMRPAPRGTQVDFEAEVIRSGRRVIFSQARALLATGENAGTVIATAQIAKARVVHQEPSR